MPVDLDAVQDGDELRAAVPACRDQHSGLRPYSQAMWICADSPPTGSAGSWPRLDLLLGALTGTSMLVRVSNGGGRSSLAG
jgi:hypothetical protein